MQTGAMETGLEGRSLDDNLYYYIYRLLRVVLANHNSQFGVKLIKYVDSYVTCMGVR